ncbi:MAG: hypothetical protein MI864_21675, partial [Pseudomonadales bacterium]|nr:hypothetical protein [Pseudomonadales bacterium]
MIRCKLYPSIKRVGQARKWFGILACCGFAASISNVTAHGLDNPPQWHGFANQGFSYTTENNFLGESSEGSFKFLEAGLNASWRALNTLQISGQLLYRQTGNAPPDGVEVDYAIADWRVLDTFDYGFGVRAGRIKNPYGFFNETRDVAATRPSILLPESIYIDYLRELMHSSDSVGLYGHSELAGGTATFYAVFGRPILYDTTIPAIIYTQTQGSLEDEAIYSARVGYEDGSGIWRVAVSVADFRADYLAADTEPLFDGKSHITQFLFSAEGYWQNFRLTGEYQRRLIR